MKDSHHDLGLTAINLLNYKLLIYPVKSLCAVYLLKSMLSNKCVEKSSVPLIEKTRLVYKYGK